MTNQKLILTTSTRNINSFINYIEFYEKYFSMREALTADLDHKSLSIEL